MYFENSIHINKNFNYKYNDLICKLVYVLKNYISLLLLYYCYFQIKIFIYLFIDHKSNSWFLVTRVLLATTNS